VIDLLTRTDRTGFGLATALEIEGIPFRHIRCPEEASGRLLVVSGGALTPAVLALAARVPTLILGAPATPPGALFGVSAGRTHRSAAAISLRDPVWRPAVRAAALRFGKEALRLPWTTAFCPETGPDGAIVATLRRPGGAVQPAIAKRGGCHWSLVDLGAALAHLLDESYLPPGKGRVARPMPRPALQLYYRVPEPLRQSVQRRVYRRLHEGLAQQPTPSDYPVDATGWLLLELLKQLIRSAAGGLVRLARWPAPYAAAAALTHDLEPTRFAYTDGLEALLAEIRQSGHPPTFGVVTGAAERHLGRGRIDQLRDHDVLCHGLEHRGETLAGSFDEIANGIAVARCRLERQLERRVAGFRSPRLDRSPDLLWAVERAGFGWDSSYPDVDRENMTHFGAGVRLNLPFRPPLEDGEHVRPSACLELPVSAPDCIQPLFEGDDVRTLRRAVREKVAFVRATGGLYMGIVHAGVFGARDAVRRGTHLAFVRDQLRQPDVWLASASEIAEWWCARERITISLGEGVARVVNRGSRPLERVRLLVEVGECERAYDLPALVPGDEVTVALGQAGPWACAS
jgi:hypothetical protein